MAKLLKIYGHIDNAQQAIETLSTPQMRDVVQRLQKAVNDEVLTVKEVAGITDTQMQGGYAAACAFLEQGQPLTALQVLAPLMYLDHKNGAYLQLAGLAVHHLKMFCLADYFYGVALIYAPDDPRTLIYRGEAKIMSQERHAGLALLKQGLELCGGKPALQDVAQRGTALVKQFSAPRANRPEP